MPGTGAAARSCTGERKKARLKIDSGSRLASAPRRTAQGLRLLSVATTTSPPDLVTRNSSATALFSSAMNSSAATETVLAKDPPAKGRETMSAATAAKGISDPPETAGCVSPPLRGSPSGRLFFFACLSMAGEMSTPTTSAPRARNCRVKIPVPLPASRILSPFPGRSSDRMSSLS